MTRYLQAKKSETPFELLHGKNKMAISVFFAPTPDKKEFI